MRVGLAFTLIAAACGGTGPPRRTVEPLDDPDRSSFAGYRPETQGCIHGDCKVGRYARRTGNRTIAGTVGTPEVLIEWERGACAGWTYRGAAEADQPHGRGELRPRGGPFVSVTGQFVRGALSGRAEATAYVAGEDKPSAVSGDMLFDPAECAVHFDPAALESVVIENVWFKSSTGVDRVMFRGVVGVENEKLVPLRGVMDVSGKASASGYVERELGGSAYVMTEKAVCLSAHCANGDGAEHLGGGERFELYQGTFTRGVRSGPASLYRIHPFAGARQLQVFYERGEIRKTRVVRSGYTIGERIADLGVLGDKTTHSIEGVGPAPLGIQWSLDHGLLQITSGEPDAVVPIGRDVPPELGRVLALIASVAQDLDRHPGIRLCLTCEWHPTTAKRPQEHAAVVDGPRTPFIAILDNYTEDRQTRIVVEAWLADHHQWVVGKDLWLFDEFLPSLSGTADLIRRDSTRKPVVLYRGRRIDPLGFKSVAAYERAKARDIKARAKRHAKAAGIARARGENQTAALRRLVAGIGIEQSQLENARTQIAGAASDTAGYERVIRGSHVAVERAYDAVLDARYGIEDALATLADDDPTLDSVAALGAYLRDHDERLRVLLLAFEAFEYSDDVDRLATIRTAFTDDIAAFPIGAIAPYLAELREVMSGGALTYPDPQQPEVIEPTPIGDEPLKTLLP